MAKSGKTGGKRRVIKRRRKDPNAPRRSLTCYMLYAQDRRPQLQSEQPNLPMKEVIRKMGQEWRSLTASQKKPYIQEAERLKQIYLQQKAAYVPPPQEKPKKRKKVKDPNAPKRPFSSYMLFAQDRRPAIQKKNPKMAMKNVISKLGAEWRSLSAKGKKPYQKEADRLRAIYLEAKANYTPPPVQYVDEDEPKKRRKKDPNAPKRSLSSYMLFAQDRRPELQKNNPEMKMKEIIRTMGKEWRSFTDKKKAKYVKEAARLKVLYMKAVAAYKKSKKN